MVSFPDDDLMRRRCQDCDWIQYRNPTVGVAVIVIEAGQLLIGRRRDGGWCIPCGHVEWDESIEEAAMREMLEETGLQVKLDGVFAAQSNFHAPNLQTVGIWYRGRRLGGSLQAGADLLEVTFVDLQTLPELKFPTDAEVVRRLRSIP